MKKKHVPVFVFLLLAAAVFAGAAQAADKPRLKVALTFDDLPLNGGLPLGSKMSDFARDTIRVLKKHRIPPSYGFINANKLERNPDGALALRIWVEGGHPLANHTYDHLDLITHSVEEFQREIVRNEVALQLLMPPDSKVGQRHDWRWFRYPYLHEGETLEKRRAVRAFLANNGYRIAQTTMDFGDYYWNSAYARCVMKKDSESIQWLRESYLTAARDLMRMDVENSRRAFGRDINHVLLLHLGSFSSHILPDLFKLMDEEGYEIVTLEEAQKDPVYDYDPDVADRGGTLTDLTMRAKQIPWPENSPQLPSQRLTSICQ
jgi:peptidoglycan/xylan/chitin deacetylase (PgdA/CDA1 family)